MSLAIFDLDNTLIAGDSDYSWGEFLVAKNRVDGDRYRRMNEQFYRAYQAGDLDIHDYLRFALRPLADLPPEELAELHRQFMTEVIAPMWLPRAVALVQEHRQRGDFLLVVTATNRFVVEPICRRLGMDDVIATELEIVNDRYTGAAAGVPSFREGKVQRLQAWLSDSELSLAGSTFYSDSINDLALLEKVEIPVAVDPDDRLRAEAERRHWKVISLRD